MEKLTIEELASKEKIVKTEIDLLDVIKKADLEAEEAEKVLTRLMYELIVAISVASKEDYSDVHARVCAKSCLLKLKNTNEESK
ncbi:MAG: hypothetical protein KBT34_08760 [Prevotella sp.]|nr:hypothetical protein [Candidatus Prevotella equi]